MKTTKGGKVMNPTDAYRKELRKKELKRNKKERKKVREVGILKKDPNTIKEQIDKLEMMKADGALDKARKHKKRQLEDTLNLVLKKRKEYEEKMREKGEEPVMFSHLGPPRRRSTAEEEQRAKLQIARYHCHQSRMALAASSAQATNIAAAAPAHRPAAARSSSLTRSLPSVFQLRGEISEFAGLKSTSGCITYGRHVRENSLSLFDALDSHLVVAKAGKSGGVRGETVAKMKVAINGFGRIGRNFMRSWHGHKRSPLEVVAINDTIGIENAAHLLKYDSIMGKFEADVEGVFKAPDANSHRIMKVDGKQIFVLSERDPSLLPWKDLGVDLVIEATGKFTERTQAEKHIGAGAKKVIITAPGRGDDIPTYVVGINDSEYSHEEHNIISNGSGTINCLAPLIQTLDKEFGGVVKGTVSATLSYTSDQSLLDAIHCDRRRARAAALNIVPTPIDLSINTLSRLLPSTLNLKDNFSGIAMRVPTPNVSVVDLVVNVGNKGFTVDDVKKAFKKAAADGPLKGILAVCDEHLVSMDFRGSHASAIVDTTLTMVMGEDMIKVVAWFDNEWAYSQRVVEFAHTVHAKYAATLGEEVLTLVDEQICTVNTEQIECKIYDV